MGHSFIYLHPMSHSEPPPDTANNQSPTTQEAQAAVDMFAARRYTEATALAQQLTTRFPAHSFGWKLLGAIYAQTGRHIEALGPLRTAGKLSPSDAEVHSTLGVALIETNQLDAAVESCLRAVEIRPDFAEAHSNLGIAFNELGRFDEALASCRRALEIRPDFAEAHNTLGGISNHLERFDEAVLHCCRAIQIRPNFVLAYCNLGAALNSLGRFADAIASYHQAIEIDPRHVDAHYNMGNALRDLGQVDAALDSYRRALGIDPVFHKATWNLGLTMLTQGRYAEGWPHYEARTVIGNKNTVAPQVLLPRWHGESLQGESLLLWPEQGFGDYVQFVRYARLLKGRGVSRLTVRCPAPLRDLLATAAGVDEVITDADPVPLHDYWSFPLSLP
ncbi:tetratricopeptide repeat protein, partial [Paraburkholderia fungorum]|uniref:tetratricopeptide repeat protein n=1 Tax=Paraburkholderia fungorum TaxID=134537 RepID=UPI0038B8DEBE